MRHAPLLALATCLLAAAPPARAADFVPLLKLDALGGQFFFEGENTSFSGNADWVAGVGAKLSERDMLVASWSGQYRRTREVEELVGGGFLTQESLENTASLKYVRALSEDWALKPSVSYKSTLLTEDEEETLGSGLFDYHKLSFGLEGERRGELFKSVRHALSVYAVRFYHYSALAASSEDFGEEISAGDQVLDFNAYDYSISADLLPWEGTLFSASTLVSYRRFIDQPIVTVAGTYEADDRRDWVAAGAASWQQELPGYTLLGRRAQDFAGINLSYTWLDSDQNNYDAARTRFNPDFYDYGELTVGPFYSVKFGEGLSVTAAYDYARRDYRTRPIQSVDGDYGDEAIDLNTHTFTCSLSYPLGGGISAKVQGAWRRTRSNMKFEQTYRYNYDSAHYFAGLSFAL